MLDSPVMPARRLLQALVVTGATLILGPLVILLCPWNRHGPLFVRLARLWSGCLFRAAGLRLEVGGAEHVPADRAVALLANHVSLLDPPALFLAIPGNFRVVAKRSLFLVPIFGQALWAAGIIPIDRRRRERAIASLDRAAALLRRGLPVLLFPEGTRARAGGLQPFKKGPFVLALQAGVDIVPVIVRGTREALPKATVFARPGVVRVDFLPPVPTAHLTLADRDRLMAEVHARMSAAS